MEVGISAKDPVWRLVAFFDGVCTFLGGQEEWEKVSMASEWMVRKMRQENISTEKTWLKWALAKTTKQEPAGIKP